MIQIFWKLVNVEAQHKKERENTSSNEIRKISQLMQSEPYPYQCCKPEWTFLLLQCKFSCPMWWFFLNVGAGLQMLDVVNIIWWMYFILFSCFFSYFDNSACLPYTIISSWGKVNISTFTHVHKHKKKKKERQRRRCLFLEMSLHGCCIWVRK